MADKSEDEELEHEEERAGEVDDVRAKLLEDLDLEVNGLELEDLLEDEGELQVGEDESSEDDDAVVSEIVSERLDTEDVEGDVKVGGVELRVGGVDSEKELDEFRLFLVRVDFD